MPDVVARIVQLVRERIPADDAVLRKIERDARLMMAGERHRITENPRDAITFADVDQRLRRRMSVRQVAADLGVARSTIYRVLKNKRRPRSEE
jgi:IS30 family transposase